MMIEMIMLMGFLFMMLDYEYLSLFIYLFIMIIFLFNLDYISCLGEFIYMGSSLGIDFFSFYMILLSIWLVSMIFMFEKDYFIRFLVLFFLMMVFIMFLMINLMGFFLFFESSIMPVFFMILMYGLSKDRYISGLYMIIFTLLSSLPMFMVLMYINTFLYSLSIVGLMYMLFEVDWWIQFIFIMMFLVKVPMFFVHIWLPKAHVEAPLCGSMLLASIMLKMGSYGIVRMKMIMEIDLWMADIFLTISLVSGIILSFSCLFQSDLKVMVAYSSIIHMSMMLVGLMSGEMSGFMGGILMMFSHGICSSVLFYMVNEFYLVTGSRLIYMNKGMHVFFPIYMYMWILCLSNNLGVPPCFSLLGELLVMVGLFMYNLMMFVYSLLMIYCVSWFMMVLMYLYICCGGLGVGNVLDKSISMKSYLIVFIHLVPLNSLIYFLIDLF